MKKLFTVLIAVIATIPFATRAETIKITSKCTQVKNSIYVHVPIKLQYTKLHVSYNKLLHLFCRDDLCMGMTMDTDIKSKGLDIFDLTLIENLKRTVDKPGYVVFEWGINVVTVDLNNKKVTWNETGSSDAAIGSGTAACN
jgi:hypothetical protein